MSVRYPCFFNWELSYISVYHLFFLILNKIMLYHPSIVVFCFLLCWLFVYHCINIQYCVRSRNTAFLAGAKKAEPAQHISCPTECWRWHHILYVPKRLLGLSFFVLKQDSMVHSSRDYHHHAIFIEFAIPVRYSPKHSLKGGFLQRMNSNDSGDQVILKW